MPGLTVPEGREIEDIVRQSGRLGTEFIHQSNGPFDNVAELPRALVCPLQNRRGTLKMVLCKNIGWRHAVLLGRISFVERQKTDTGRKVDPHAFPYLAGKHRI